MITSGNIPDVINACNLIGAYAITQIVELNKRSDFTKDIGIDEIYAVTDHLTESQFCNICDAITCLETEGFIKLDMEFLEIRIDNRARYPFIEFKLTDNDFDTKFDFITRSYWSVFKSEILDYALGFRVYELSNRNLLWESEGYDTIYYLFGSSLLTAYGLSLLVEMFGVNESIKSLDAYDLFCLEHDMMTPCQKFILETARNDIIQRGYVTLDMGYFEFTINAWPRVSYISFNLLDLYYLEEFNLIIKAYWSPRKTEVIEQRVGFLSFVICRRADL